MSERRALGRSAPFKVLLFEEIAFGRADRRDFLRGIAVVGAALLLSGLLFNWFFLTAERLSDGDAVAGAALIAQLVGFAIAGALAVIVPTFAFAGANVIAKRLRDLGLPGWNALAVAWVLGAALSLGAPFLAAAFYVLVVWLLLFLLPSGRPR